MLDDDELAAFEALVHTTLPRLLSLGRRLGLQDTEADDVAAEALARLVVSWKKLADHPRRDAWLLRVAANVATDQARRAGRAPQIRSVPVDGHEAGVVDRIVIDAAVAQLPARQREAIALHYFADLSVQDVSTAMHTSLNTTKKNLARGLERLRSTGLTLSEEKR